MWMLDHKKGWAPKNWGFWTVVLGKTLASPLYCREIKPVNPKGSQPWIFIGRNDVEAETPIIWSPDAKNWLIGKDPDAGRDWRQEEKGMAEDEMVGWMASPTGCTWVWASSRSWWYMEAWRAAVYEVTESQTGLSDWTDVILKVPANKKFPVLEISLINSLPLCCVTNIIFLIFF